MSDKPSRVITPPRLPTQREHDLARQVSERADRGERVEEAACLALHLYGQEVEHRTLCEGAFSLDRDPLHLMPAIDAYAEERISGGKLRECVRRWLAGANFRDPDQREWDEHRRASAGEEVSDD